MTVTVTSFRKDYNRVFNDTAAYPDDAILYWLQIAALLLRPTRLGASSATADSPPTTLYDFATELFVAHNIVLEKMSADTAAEGGDPGLSDGVVSSKSVGGISVSYDTNAGLEEKAGHWSLTRYGTRLIRLLRFVGAGPVQVNIGIAPPFSLGSFGAWPGPYPFPQPGDGGFG